MPRATPTPEDIPLPGVQGQRPVAGYDVSAFGQGAQAIAKGVQTLGTDVQKSAQDVAEVQTYRARNSALLAQDKILGDAIGLREKYKHDQDFGTLQERYNTDLDGLVDQGIQNVPQGPLRDHVMARLQIPIAHERASVEDQVFQGRRQNAHADIYDRQKSLVETAPPFDDPLHTAKINSFKDIADEYGRQGLLTPLEVAQHKQQLGADLADARARARIDLGPAEAAKVERELRESVPKGGQSTFRPTQRADASAFLRARTGARVEGLNPVFADRLTQAAQDYERETGGTAQFESLKRTTAEQAEIYRRHLQMPGGVAAHPAAPPGSSRHEIGEAGDITDGPFQQWMHRNGDRYGLEFPVRNDPGHVQLAAGNVTPLRQQEQAPPVRSTTPAYPRIPYDGADLPPTSASASGPVKVLADYRTGKAGVEEAPDQAPGEAGGNPLFAKLTPQHRDALIAHAQQAQHKFKTEGQAQLKAGIKDDIDAAAQEGYVGKGRSRDDFVQVYGDEEGEGAFREYNEQMQLAMDMHNMSGMSPEERQSIIAAHRPDPSQPGYAARLGPYGKLVALNDQITKAQDASATKERQAAVKDLGERAKSVAIEASRTGQIPQGIPRDEFIKTLGEEQGAAAWNSYTDATQYAADLYHLGEKTPEEKLAAVSAYEPKPGQDNTEQAWQRHDELFKAANALHKQLTDDPTGYMLRNSPPVREAWEQFTQATAPEDQAKAAQDYATKTTAEQQRFGVAPEDVKVVPDSYAENFKSRVEGMALAGNGNQVQAAIKGEQEKWGSAWPQVYRQVTDGDAMLRVVGAGVKSSAGQLLTNNAKVKFGDIVKDEQSAKAKDITENVDTAMAPFASSLIGNAGGIRLYNDVRGQVEKLSAIYAFQNGMSAPDAAKQAAADVLDFKYDYRDGFRIPAKEHTNPAGVPSDQIQIGAAVAKHNLGGSIGGVDLKVRPAIDTFGAAYTPAQLASETADTKRNGRWTTNGDESGLWFTYGGQVVRKPDGTPLALTWQQLGDLGKKNAEDTRAMGRMTPGAQFRAGTAAALEAERARNAALPSFHNEELEFPRHPNGQYRR
jgi:hypothetical protein